MKATSTNQLVEAVLGIVSSNEFLAVTVLVLGLILGIVVRAILLRLSHRFSDSAEGYLNSLEVALERIAPIAFWAILIFSVLWSVQILEIQSKWQFLSLISEQIPKFILAIAIILLAHLLGTAVRDILRRTITDTRIGRLSGSAAYLVVILLGLIVSLQQVGIDISFVGIGMLVFVGVFAITLGLAFAAGAQHHVANLIARQELTRYKVGDRIRIDDIEGTVTDIERTKIVLLTTEGLATVPASRFAQTVALVVSDQD